MNRIPRIAEIVSDLVDLRIINDEEMTPEKIFTWAEVIDKNLPESTTAKQIEDFCNDFIIGNKKWDRFIGVANIITFPLRSYTPREVQDRKNKLGLG